MYLIGIIIITVVLLFLSFLSRFRNLRENHSFFFNFLLTMSATFVGVFLALFLSNYESNELEREQVIRLIEVAKDDLHTTAIRGVGIFHTNSDDLTGQSENDTREFIKNNPLPFPQVFNTIIKSEIILRHISTTTFKYLAGSKENLNKCLDTINNRKLPNESSIRTRVFQYEKQLDLAQHFLSLEILLLKGKITHKKLTEVNLKKIQDVFEVAFDRKPIQKPGPEDK